MGNTSLDPLQGFTALETPLPTRKLAKHTLKGCCRAGGSQWAENASPVKHCNNPLVGMPDIPQHQPISAETATPTKASTHAIHWLERKEGTQSRRGTGIQANETILRPSFPIQRGPSLLPRKPSGGRGGGRRLPTSPSSGTPGNSEPPPPPPSLRTPRPSTFPVCHIYYMQSEESLGDPTDSPVLQVWVPRQIHFVFLSNFMHAPGLGERHQDT